MNYKKYLPLLPAALVASSCTNLPIKKETPNILLIIVDDLGWADLECYGNNLHETPNINKLADNGIRFTNSYASCPVSSPTRASIMTGKYPTTVNITDYISGKQNWTGVLPEHKFIVPEFNFELPHKEITIAEKLKTIGYKTIHIGKWHLGDTGYLPTDQGFDINIGGCHHGMPGSYYYPYKNGKRWVENIDLNDKDSLYLTDRLTNEAIKFIEGSKNEKFFMYLPFYSVHTPIEGKPELVEYYKEKIKKKPHYSHKFDKYAAMVHSVDENIGRIIKTLSDNEMLDNTLIIFSSDNGGLKYKNESPTNNYPLRASKGTAYEGGIRIPTIIHWNDHITDPGRDNDELICSIDYYTFIMSLTGIEDETSEGMDLMPILNNDKFERTKLYWHYPHYHLTKPVGAIRSGKYKLIEYFEDNRLELYDLSEDIGETNNIAKEHPDKVNEMYNDLEKWRAKTNAKMPTLNPNWDSTKVYVEYID